MPHEFQDRIYLPCTDFTESGVKNFANRLSNELFALISKYYQSNRSLSFSFEQKDALRRRNLVKKLAHQISDNQEKANSDSLLTNERLEFIVTSLEPQRKVELLALYELQRGKFMPLTLMENFEKYHFLDIEFKQTGLEKWSLTLDWTSSPFGHLQKEYGLGDEKYEVREVFLNGLDELSEEDRKELFSGIEIVNCSFGR